MLKEPSHFCCAAQNKVLVDTVNAAVSGKTKAKVALGPECSINHCFYYHMGSAAWREITNVYIQGHFNTVNLHMPGNGASGKAGKITSALFQDNEWKRM